MKKGRARNIKRSDATCPKLKVKVKVEMQQEKQVWMEGALHPGILSSCPTKYVVIICTEQSRDHHRNKEDMLETSSTLILPPKKVHGLGNSRSVLTAIFGGSKLPKLDIRMDMSIFHGNWN